MQRNDKLMVKIDQIQNTQVYIAKSKDYRWLTHLDKQVVYDNDVFEIAGAYLDFYIIGVSLQIYKGKFRMQTWVEQDAQVVDESYTQPATESDEVVAEGEAEGVEEGGEEVGGGEVGEGAGEGDGPVEGDGPEEGADEANVANLSESSSSSSEEVTPVDCL